MLNAFNFNLNTPLIIQPTHKFKKLLGVSMATDYKAIIKALTNYPQEQAHLVTLSKKEVEATRKVLKNNPGLTGMLPVKNGTLADGKDFIQIGVHRIVAA